MELVQSCQITIEVITTFSGNKPISVSLKNIPEMKAENVLGIQVKLADLLYVMGKQPNIKEIVKIVESMK
jgi:hypothetical protein